MPVLRLLQKRHESILLELRDADTETFRKAVFEVRKEERKTGRGFWCRGYVGAFRFQKREEIKNDVAK